MKPTGQNVRAAGKSGGDGGANRGGGRVAQPIFR